jgi:hypothetical protein
VLPWQVDVLNEAAPAMAESTEHIVSMSVRPLSTGSGGSTLRMELTAWLPRASIIWLESVLRGTSDRELGVFTDINDKYTYAGQHRAGHVYGCGVITENTGYSAGSKIYAEYGADGRYSGRCVRRSGGASGSDFDVLAHRSDRSEGWTEYTLYEHGEDKASVSVSSSGGCQYRDGEGRGTFGRGESCKRDDPRVLKLIAQIAPVEVRRAAPAAHPQSPRTRPQAIVRWISRLVLPPQALATAMAAQVHPPRRTPSLLDVRHTPTTAAMQIATTQ